MSSRAWQPMRDFADKWDRAYPSAVFSGIVAWTGGYHASIEDSVPGSYSVVRVDDAAPPGNWRRDLSAAVDMSMNATDMVKCYWRIHRVWSNPNDPRRKYFNAFNGWDGSGDAVRMDFVTGRIGWASPDHKWHTHGEWRRRYVTDPNSYAAAESMLLTDEGIDEFLARIGKDSGLIVPSGRAPGTRTLRLTNPMMYGDDVAYVQRFIGPRRCGKADGWYGNNTRSGVMWYQRMRGILVDGIVGPQTWSHILGRTVRY